MRQKTSDREVKTLLSAMFLKPYITTGSVREGGVAISLPLQKYLSSNEMETRLLKDHPRTMNKWQFSVTWKNITEGSREDNNFFTGT